MFGTDWVTSVLLSSVGGIALLWGVGGYYHYRYYVRRAHEPARWKCQPDRFLRTRQARLAMGLSTGNMLLAGLITGTFIELIKMDVGIPIYFDVDRYGWVYTLVSTVILFVLVDAIAYYVHRLLHIRWLFRHVHRVHHRFTAPTPFVVTAMHPVELIVLQGMTFLPLLVIPLHYLSIIVVFAYVFVFNIIDHSGVRLESRLPWQGPSMYHDDHHVYFHCNFGQHLMIWDRLHGTLRRTNRRYGKDVFGGKGEPGRRELGNAFVKYR